MEFIIGLLFNIGVGVFNIFVLFFKVVIAFIGGSVIMYKRKSMLAFVIGAILIFMYPFLVLFAGLLPNKVFNLRKEIRTHPAFVGKNQLLASVFALSGIIAKFDGKVTKEEIRKIRVYIGDFFGLSSENINEYKDAFEFGKNNKDEYVEFASFIANNYNHLVRNQLLFMLMLIASEEDRTITSAMEDFLRQIAATMGISASEFKFLQMQATGEYSANADFNAEPQENLIKKYTAILGVSADATFAEIKKAYRTLAKEYHPDNYKDKPIDYITMAENRMREINVAYEYLEKVKGGH
ncbi:DnaJ domain-containing protein [Candidatus Epulonipiscium viviparus]|uniref:DnaJ domain-containing protein n=1 Tax=Candidatus Epulonipiscium viviparus TaxID=420336 RepID=UPI00273810EF|nr:DnaJ domain-containing protein [Candidatus Epulopiscium viviparus]